VTCSWDLEGGCLEIGCMAEDILKLTSRECTDPDLILSAYLPHRKGTAQYEWVEFCVKSAELSGLFRPSRLLCRRLMRCGLRALKLRREPEP
jgi:hypothetical protein